MVDAAFWVVLGEEDPFLSEFWCSLGTEIDLVALLEEICQKLEREHTTMLAFLNLSGLFSITKHSTLLSCLTGMNFRSTVFSLLQMIYQKCQGTSIPFHGQLLGPLYQNSPLCTSCCSTSGLKHWQKSYRGLDQGVTNVQIISSSPSLLQLQVPGRLCNS